MLKNGMRRKRGLVEMDKARCMRVGLYVLGLVVVVASGACHATKQNEREYGMTDRGDASMARSRTGSSRATLVTGTVRRIDLEGGFYGIETDEGMSLDPINLPEDFWKDGVRVRVRIELLEDQASVHMWGRLVRILSIERL